MDCIARTHTTFQSESALGEFATHFLACGKLAPFSNVRGTKQLCQQKAQFATLPRAPRPRRRSEVHLKAKSSFPPRTVSGG
jgi:hypothetical protein